MSRAAKATLAASVVITSLVVYGVHWLQESERQAMYMGVVRDDERRKQKQLQRQQELEESQRKRAVYEAVQPVSGKQD
ncbi:hypothetical protein EXIGLDRAFT_765046 [Exidia glandulosa HHB12029]|uniref:Cytochrome c oxidase assembly protein n=1 Tax=Exidia glandulosa HHB12029 TaxID=1314781 RepID=A0A165KSL5_EXIGL|nr:hypothetical protein EXIGLDRAFT_765046 [Exidia glandulosa HHB12029]